MEIETYLIHGFSKELFEVKKAEEEGGRSYSHLEITLLTFREGIRRLLLFSPLLVEVVNWEAYLVWRQLRRRPPLLCCCCGLWAFLQNKNTWWLVSNSCINDLFSEISIISLPYFPKNKYFQSLEICILIAKWITSVLPEFWISSYVLIWHFWPISVDNYLSYDLNEIISSL